MVLSDRDIYGEIKKKRIILDPFDFSCIQPASYDLHLGYKFRVFRNIHYPCIDPKNPTTDLMDLVEIKKGKNFVLHPNEFALGITLENIIIPDDIAGRLDGKSSLGRIGLIIHSTAGWFDPGWRGYGTLELGNVANLPIILYPEMKIGQISFLRLSSPVKNLYGSKKLGSKYQNQKEPEASKIHLEFKKKR